jgi:eukaryotic-like serine/threonine-protein kinase
MLQDLQPGDPRKVGPYRLRRVLGAGGMGRVFLGASDDGQLAAVKVIHAGLAADPVFRARFQREIEVAREVSGPFTAPVIDADLDGPMPWLATAYVAGPSLQEAVTERGPMSPPEVLEVAATLAEGLAAIHAAGVVHRDLKPSNILLAQDGPRLIDFGVSTASGATALTGTELMIGSPGFMSPEQAEGLPVGPPSDIFSLGAVLAFAATGEGPFGPGSTVALIYRVIHRPADLSHVPTEVRGLVERCLVKDPALRPTARDLLAAAGAGRKVALATTDTNPTVPLATVGAGRVRPLAAQEMVPPDLPLSPGAWKEVPAVWGEAPAAWEKVPAARAQDRPQRRGNRPMWRRHWRSLSGAAVIAGLLGAAASLMLTAAPNPAPPAAQLQRQVASTATPPPVTFAPLPSAGPRTSPAGAGKTSPAAPSQTSTAPIDSNPPASSSAPAAASPAQPADPSPSPSAVPTPAAGGYGY